MSGDRDPRVAPRALRGLGAAALLSGAGSLSGCAVAAVADAAVTVGSTAVGAVATVGGVAVDATGAIVRAAIPDGDDDDEDDD